MNTSLPKPTNTVNNNAPTGTNKGANSSNSGTVSPSGTTISATPKAPPQKIDNTANTPTSIGRSVAPTGVPKMEGINPSLAPKQQNNAIPQPNTSPKQPLAQPNNPGINKNLEKQVTKPLNASKAPPLVPNSGTPGNLATPAGAEKAVNPKVPTSGGGKPPQPQIAGAKKDPKKLAMIAAGVLIFLGIVGTIFSKMSGNNDAPVVADNANSNPTTKQEQPVKQTVLTYWGLWEPTAVLDEVIQSYQQENPGIKVDYRIQSHKDYRERLQTAIASGNGPDIFRYHSSWVPMFGEDLAVLPANVMSAADFKSTFYPSASQLLQIEGKIVGLPVMYEGLGLYYNKDILQTAGVEPPATWAELKKLATELSVPADKSTRLGGEITRGGLAIGNASNVDHFSDILALLILQNGGDPAEPAYTEVRDALVFYTNFITEDAIWNNDLPSSTVAFAKGDAAMMFAPTWRAHEVKELNPSLNFGIASVPQLSDEHIAWSNYWAEGVNDKTANKEESWAFLKHMTSPEVMKKLYSAQSNIRTFGEPYSRVDIVEGLAADPYVAGVLKDASIATGWYMSSATHDNGLNDQIIEYYAGAINSFIEGEDEEETLIILEKGVKQVLRQYGAE